MHRQLRLAREPFALGHQRGRKRRACAVRRNGWAAQGARACVLACQRMEDRRCLWLLAGLRSLTCMQPCRRRGWEREGRGHVHACRRSSCAHTRLRAFMHACARAACVLKVWDRSTGAWLHYLKGHGGPITCCRMAPGGNGGGGGTTAFSGSRDGHVMVWDLTHGSSLHTYALPGAPRGRPGRFGSGVCRPTASEPSKQPSPPPKPFSSSLGCSAYMIHEP